MIAHAGGSESSIYSNTVCGPRGPWTVPFGVAIRTCDGLFLRSPHWLGWSKANAPHREAPVTMRRRTPRFPPEPPGRSSHRPWTASAFRVPLTDALWNDRRRGKRGQQHLRPLRNRAATRSANRWRRWWRRYYPGEESASRQLIGLDQRNQNHRAEARRPGPQRKRSSPRAASVAPNSRSTPVQTWWIPTFGLGLDIRPVLFLVPPPGLNPPAFGWLCLSAERSLFGGRFWDLSPVVVSPARSFRTLQPTFSRPI